MVYQVFTQGFKWDFQNHVFPLNNYPFKKSISKQLPFQLTILAVLQVYKILCHRGFENKLFIKPNIC